MPPRRAERKKSIFARIISLLLILLFLAGASFFVGKSSYKRIITTPNSELSEKVDLVIVEGEGIDSIVQKLTKNDLLNEKYKEIFIFYLKQSGAGSKIQAGTFRIPKNLNMVELATTLQDAGVPDLWVTIPEGLRIDEVADILKEEYAPHENSVFNAKDFIKLAKDAKFIKSLELDVDGLTILEGYVFPDKYLLPIEATEEYILTAMVNTFKQKSSAVTYEQLIIASMLEREGRTDDERKMISDIIQRRLKEGWFLNIDATLLYYHKDWKYVLTEQDINLNHAYNTYTNLGLPPTPICNPGLSSLNAAQNPTANDYYYYIHDNNGNIHYARTAEEHAVNVQTYLLQ